LKYRAEIDGLRALAVVPVILFHAGFELFSGGFVGVDVFFVISGYLITTILIEDIENKRFSILNFYERRARRILPALFLVILVCIPFSWMWMLPSQMKDFSQSLVAVSLFASNILFWRESGYFDAVAEEKPLLHTWSLAVEEQYYVLFPIFLILAWRFGKNKVFWMIVVMAAISLLLSEWGWRNQATANFYFAPTRAWELFAGSIAAFIVQKRGVQKNNILALLGLVAIVFSILVYDESIPFPSVYALVPVLGVVLLVLYADKDTLAAKLLSTKLFVGIGLISYSAYLWHQPLFAFARIRLHEPNAVFFAILSLLSLLIGVLSWKYVELPFRYRKVSLNGKSSIFIYSVSLLTALFVFGVLGHFNDGFENSSQSRQELAQFATRFEVNNGMSSDCELEGDFILSENCSNSENPTLLLWGDSFAMHLYQGIQASNHQLKIRQLTASSCSPILDVSRLSPVIGMDLTWANHCLEFNKSVFNWLKSTKAIEFVVLSSPFGWVNVERTIDSNGVIYENDFDTVLRKFLQTVEKIRSLDVGVVVVSPAPLSGFNIGDCLIKKHQFNSTSTCDFDYSESRSRHDFLSAVEQHAPVYWLYKNICNDSSCKSESGGTFIYRDSGHLSKEGSALLGLSNDWYAEMRAMALKHKPIRNE
jgi:peptidoglycan/LPS O-acetylase OafA/YrhL